MKMEHKHVLVLGLRTTLEYMLIICQIYSHMHTFAMAVIKYLTSYTKQNYGVDFFAHIQLPSRSFNSFALHGWQAYGWTYKLCSHTAPSHQTVSPSPFIYRHLLLCGCLAWNSVWTILGGPPGAPLIIRLYAKSQVCSIILIHGPQVQWFQNEYFSLFYNFNPMVCSIWIGVKTWDGDIQGVGSGCLGWVNRQHPQLGLTGGLAPLRASALEQN